MNKNFILAGPPGAGKTTLGRVLASRYRYRFLDTDELIEKKVKMPILNFIEKNGWEKFREIEAKITASLPKKGTVIALGGGAILNKESAATLSKNGYIISLLPSFKITQKHTNKNHPQYKNQKKLYNERRKTYQEYADIVIRDNTSSDNIQEDIKKRIRRFEQQFFHRNT